MLFSGRAYYNLLILNRLRNIKLKDSGWDSLDYRKLSIPMLLSDLKYLGVFFTKDLFISFCQEIDSPEQLAQRLQSQEENNNRKIYLLVFELWRKLLPDKKCVSIVCDELDYIIALYEIEKNDAKLYEGLLSVVDLLNRNSPYSSSQKTLFKYLCLFMAHDLENVIYTFIESKIGAKDEDKYINLLNQFIPFLGDKSGLNLLKISKQKGGAKV